MKKGLGLALAALVFFGASPQAQPRELAAIDVFVRNVQCQEEVETEFQIFWYAEVDGQVDYGLPLSGGPPMVSSGCSIRLLIPISDFRGTVKVPGSAFAWFTDRYGNVITPGGGEPNPDA